jgi:hypothetical protein
MKTIKIITRFSMIGLLLFSINANAQKKMEIGFRYMPTISDFTMNTAEGGEVSGDAIVGYGIGTLIGFNFTNHIGVQAEIIYNSLSQKYTEQGREVRVNLKYINVPFLLSLNTNKMGSFNLNLVGGPQMGFNVGSDVHSSGGDGTYTTQAAIKIKKSDIGVAYGIGIDFGLNDAKTFRLGLGYRAVIGMIDIGDNTINTSEKSYTVVDQTKVRTHALYAGISFLF